MAKKGPRAAKTPPGGEGTTSSGAGDPVLFSIGALIIFFLGFGTAADVFRSVGWRLKTKWLYQEGQCRVVKTEVTRAETAWIVEVEHRVEANGRLYRPTTNTEEETPYAYTREEAQRLAAFYEVGRLYPCRYKAADPDAYSVLLRDGLHPWEPLGRLWLSPLLASPGIFLCWWALRRRGVRRTRAGTPP
jgi:hypothetical protein